MDSMNDMNDKKLAVFAERLKNIGSDYQQHQIREKELIRETLGDDTLDQLKKEKRLVVISRNGRNYIIKDNGKVSDSESRRRCCVIVDGDLPRYDIILVKYLAIRDRPETFKTLQETRIDHEE